nr:telomere length regulation protein tel2 [Hymenolepis microstoma]
MSIDPEVLLGVIRTLPSGLQDKTSDQTLRAYLSNPVYTFDSLNSQTIVLSQLFSQLLSNSSNTSCYDLFLYATLNTHADIWFGLLVSKLQQAIVSSGELQQCVSLLLKFLLDYGRFPQLLSTIHNISICIPTPNRYSFIVDKVRRIVNVPTIVNNSIKTALLPKLFKPEVYFPFILRHAAEVNLPQMNSILISQACLQGFGSDAWNYILQQISRSVETSNIWSSALSQIQERALESTIVPLLKKASHPHLVTICLSSALKSSLQSSLLRLFSRLLLFRHFPPCVPICIFGFLKEVITDDLYIRVEKDLGLNLLNYWSDFTALNNSSSHNRICLNQALVAWVCAFQEYIIKSPNYHTMVSCVLKGISAHLSSNIEEQKVLGMSVGEWLTEKLEIGKKEGDDSEQIWLKFEYTENEAVKQVKPLFQPIPPYISSESQQDYDLKEIFSQPSDVSSTKSPSKVLSITSELDSDDDPDGEEIDLAQKFPKLPEYSKPAPTGWPFRERRPHYLRECMDGLSGVQHESDDVSSNEVALSCFAYAKELIYRHRGGAVDEIAISFADILLHTEPPACPDTDKVNESRNEALIALAVTSPRRTVRYLTGQLTQSSLGINQYHVIIAVLTTAAVELKENFVPVVGDFFFPMLRAADHWASRKPDDVYSHLDDGILARLVASLGSMYALASNSPSVPRMVKGLLDLSEALLTPNRDPTVRRALLTTLNVMLTATNSAVFAANYQLFLSSDFTGRLLRTLQVETDSDCQKLAQYALGFLRQSAVEFVGADLGGLVIAD